MEATRIRIPTLVRVKPKALSRLGLYLARHDFRQVALIISDGLPTKLHDIVRASFSEHGIHMLMEEQALGHTFDLASGLARQIPGTVQVMVVVGGGKAIDLAKAAATEAGLPLLVAPTSLSHDGFASPSASLIRKTRRESVPVRLPFGIVIDTAVCLEAPRVLWIAGVGDLMAKLTAVADWKLAFHRKGTPVNDLAALISDSTVLQFMARPVADLDGTRTLATALLLNGVAMEIAGSSRPASGSEHLWSHALDKICQHPRLHGLQVGMATYLVSRLQGAQTEKIAHVYDAIGFWDCVRQDPFTAEEWVESLRLAPTLKSNFYTVLSERDWTGPVRKMLSEDRRLKGCFAR